MQELQSMTQNGADLERHGPCFEVLLAASASLSETPFKYRALVDTGAQFSAIDCGVRKELQLRLHDLEPVEVVGFNTTETMLCDMYLACLSIPGLNLQETVPFLEGRLKAARVSSVILGRDFLRAMRLGYNGETGRVTLCRI